VPNNHHRHLRAEAQSLSAPPPLPSFLTQTTEGIAITGLDVLQPAEQRGQERANEEKKEDTWDDFSVLMRRNFRDWCGRIGESPSFYTQFVEGVATALNASTANVSVHKICTYDGSVCRFKEASCSDDMMHAMAIPLTTVRSLPSADEEDAGDGEFAEAGAGTNGEGWTRTMDARMQVVFAVPPEYVDALTHFLIASARGVSRLEIILVEMAPSNLNASVCSEPQFVDGEAAGSLWGRFISRVYLLDDDDVEAAATAASRMGSESESALCAAGICARPSEHMVCMSASMCA